MWVSLHHVMKNGQFRVPTRFLWRPRYALHGFAVYYEQNYRRPFPLLPPSTTGADEDPCCIPCRNDGWHHVSSTVPRQQDAKEFVQAIIKEVNRCMDCNNRTLQKRCKVPEDFQIVPSVSALQCKRDLTTTKIKSHKARLNLHGGKQVYVMNYFETYAPFVTLFAINLMDIFSMFSAGPFDKWTLLWHILKLQSRWTSSWNNHKRSRLYIGIPRTTWWSWKEIYGQKQAGHVWNFFLVDKLMSVGSHHCY